MAVDLGWFPGWGVLVPVSSEGLSNGIFLNSPGVDPRSGLMSELGAGRMPTGSVYPGLAVWGRGAGGRVSRTRGPLGQQGKVAHGGGACLISNQGLADLKARMQSRTGSEAQWNRKPC